MRAKFHFLKTYPQVDTICNDRVMNAIARYLDISIEVKVWTNTDHSDYASGVRNLEDIPTVTHYCDKNNGWSNQDWFGL